MKTLRTKGYLKRAKFPTNLEWLREMNKRSALDKNLHDELYRLEAEEAGEQFVVKKLEEFGSSHGVVMPVFFGEKTHFRL